MKKWIFGLAVLALLSSCADFFTNSWGKNSGRDPTFEVTPSNVDRLLREYNGNTAASREILREIAGELEGNPNPALQAAAVKAAAQASGIATAALTDLGDLLAKDTNDPDAAYNFLNGIKGKTTGNDLTGISKDIVASLPVDTSSATPVFKGDFADKASSSDLTILVLALVLAESEKTPGGLDAYINKWTTPGGKTIDNNNNLTPSEKVIAAAVNKIAQKDKTLGPLIENLFK
jgi:hypothetical protein